jgi:hypothetical protein
MVMPSGAGFCRYGGTHSGNGGGGGVTVFSAAISVEEKTSAKAVSQTVTLFMNPILGMVAVERLRKCLLLIDNPPEGGVPRLHQIVHYLHNNRQVEQNLHNPWPRHHLPVRGTSPG